MFLQTPRLHEEAALALGATRWEMIRMAVLPFGRSGTSACMPTWAGARGDDGRRHGPVALDGDQPGPLTSTNPNTIAANIALNFPEAYGLGTNQLIATAFLSCS